MNTKIKKIKSLRELDLIKAKLQYQVLDHEKAILETSSDIVDSFTDKIRNLAFDLGASIVIRLISSFHKNKKDR